MTPLERAAEMLWQIAQHEAQHGGPQAILMPAADLKMVLTDYIAQAQQRQRLKDDIQARAVSLGAAIGSMT